MKLYEKHLIKCKCILPQFKNSDKVINHHFVVFSVINDDGSLEPSFAQCDNCNVIHKIVEIGKSVVLKKEEANSIETIDEVKTSLPENLLKLIGKYELSLSTWQEIRFILENQIFGKPVILIKEQADGITQGKYLEIFGENLFKINTFSRNEFVGE